MNLKKFFTVDQIYKATIKCESIDCCHNFSNEKYLTIANAIRLHFENGRKKIDILKKAGDEIGYGMSNEKGKSFNWDIREFDRDYQYGRLCYFEQSLFSVLEEAYKYLYEI